MSIPKFSIVIPTRNRAETLKYAIKTCLNQNFEDYEIIISDNFSSPDTQEVVEKFNDDRLIFIRTNKPLAMSENWEFAISRVRGEYVILIGDDDALLNNSLSYLDEVIESTNENVIRWEWILYYWPNFFINNLKDKICIPLNNGSTELYSTEIIKKVANYELHYKTLPMLYNSAVHCSILKKIKEKNGVFFNSQAPDIYSGFVIAKSVKKYLSLDTPLSIAALSKSSNGAAQLFTTENSSIREDFTKLNDKAGLTWHEKVPSINVLPAIIADCYYHARDVLFPDEEDIIDYSRFLKNCLTNIAQLRDEDIDRIKMKCIKNPELMDMIEFEYRKNLFIHNYKLKFYRIMPKFLSDCLKELNLPISDKIEINLKNLGISNVFEATEFLIYCQFPENFGKPNKSSGFFNKKIYENFILHHKFYSALKNYPHST